MAGLLSNGLLGNLSNDLEGNLNGNLLVELNGSGVVTQFLGGLLHDDLLGLDLITLLVDLGGYLSSAYSSIKGTGLADLGSDGE